MLAAPRVRGRAFDGSRDAPLPPRHRGVRRFIAVRNVGDDGDRQHPHLSDPPATRRFDRARGTWSRCRVSIARRSKCTRHSPARCSDAFRAAPRPTSSPPSRRRVARSGQWAATPIARARRCSRASSRSSSRGAKRSSISSSSSRERRDGTPSRRSSTPSLVAQHYAVHAPRYLRARRRTRRIPAAHDRASSCATPSGSSASIAPWNFPLILSITDAIAALVAGNAVVLRPDVQSSFTALAAPLLYEAGFRATCSVSSPAKGTSSARR